MTVDELVRTITREVLARLQKPAASTGVLILSGQDGPNVQALLQQLGEQSQVSFWNGDVAPPPCARLVLPLLTCSQMADLALGRASDPILDKVLSALLCGVAVEVFEYEYLRYKRTAPRPLFTLYSSYQERLRSFGLKSFAAGGKVGAGLIKSLVTEQDVLEAHKQGHRLLQVYADAKLTPLALDCARERGVQFQKIERSSR